MFSNAARSKQLFSVSHRHLQLSCRNFYSVEVQFPVSLPSCSVSTMRRPWRRCAFWPSVTSVGWEWQRRPAWCGRGVHLWAQGSVFFMASLLSPVASPPLWLWCACLSGHQVNTRSTSRFSSAAPPLFGPFTGINGPLARSRSPDWEAARILARWSISLGGTYPEPKVWGLACSTRSSDSLNTANTEGVY